MTDVEAIARNLTKAQRRAILGSGAEWTFLGHKTVHPSAAQSLKLYWPELAEYDWIKKTPRSTYGKSAIRLTPLGLAVKAHLERTAHD